MFDAKLVYVDCAVALAIPKHGNPVKGEITPPKRRICRAEPAETTPSLFTPKVRQYAYVNPECRTSFFSLSRAIRALIFLKMCRVCHGGCVVRLLRMKWRDSPPGRAQTCGHGDPTFVLPLRAPRNTTPYSRCLIWHFPSPRANSLNPTSNCASHPTLRARELSGSFFNCSMFYPRGL